MTCPGGCIGGGGQPRFTDNRVREARIAAIYREDESKQAPQVAREPAGAASSTRSSSASPWARSRTTCCTPSTRRASGCNWLPLSLRERVEVRGHYDGRTILGIPLVLFIIGGRGCSLPGTVRVDDMPTVLRVGSYRFHFYSDESREPAHIHVRHREGECKFWLDPAVLAQ